MIESLLIAADDPDSLPETLAKAATIEHFTGATLRVAMTLYDPIAEEPAAHFSPTETQAIIDRLMATEARALAAQVAPFASKVAEIDSRIVWAKDTAAGLIAEARRVPTSLLIKPRQAHSSLADILHAPVDWRLMRDAPCPVLFTNRTPWRKPVVILAALDAADTTHDALNRTIIRYAQQFQGVLDGQLHLVTAHPDLGQSVNAYQVADDFEGMKQSMRQSRHALLQHYVDALQVTNAQIHVVAGKPQRVISNLAQELGASLVVVGTAARRGLGKLLIGNTAEDIGRHLATDLLTVREADA